MNKDRRKRITEIIDRLNDLQVLIYDLKDEEEEAYGNLPESIQDGERGQAMEAAAYNLDEAWDNLSEAIDSLEEAKA